MHHTIKDMQKDIDLYISESRKQVTEIENLRRSRDELRSMYHEENRKLLYESQHFKDKLDSLKTELYDLKKLHKEMLDYKQMYEDLKTREDERHRLEIREKTITKVKRLTEINSLIGHIKQVKVGNSQTQKISCFSLETYKYLEFEDICKFIGLNREFSQTFLKYNTRLFVRMQRTQCRELSIRLRDLSTQCD